MFKQTRRSRVCTAKFFIFSTFYAITTHTRVHAQSKGPGPRAGHCVVEHGNVLYFLGGTPPVSSDYAAFTSLKLPVNSVSTADPETLPWLNLPDPPVAVQITNLTMSYQSLAPTATPSWIDCFVTDDGRIVVVGGNFQLLEYYIATATWSDAVTLGSSLSYGPSVASNPFLNPVYIQSRILADGHTALIVCTLTWNSQPLPYYLDTNSWRVTLAIGTPLTTPLGTGSTNGWGLVPGGGSLLPPAGFRHYTLAILGQDKSKASDHYGNGEAFLVGGYSTLVTGQVQDWNSITSFPVQQAPSNVVVMFGNAGTLSAPTRGSVAYPVSLSELDILPGNGGGSLTQQDIDVYNQNQNTVAMLSGITGGPGNAIFRGATVIGQGAQIFVQGGVTTLEFGSGQTYPPLNDLVQSVGVWNGNSQQWGDTANIFVPKKSKGLMIGLIVGGVVLLVLIGLGIWYYKRRQRLRRLEEDERQAKGMVLKNEDQLQKEHKISRPSNVETADGRSSTAYPMRTAHGSPDRSIYAPLQQLGLGYTEDSSTARSSLNSPQSYTQAELIDDDAVAALSGNPSVLSSQEYPTTTLSYVATSNFSRAPSHYQTVVNVEGRPIFGMASHGVAKHELAGIEPAPLSPKHQANGYDERASNLRGRQDDPSQVSISESLQSTLALSSSADIRSSLHSQATLPETRSNHQQSLYMSSPTFSTTYSIPDSTQGGDYSFRSPIRPDPSSGDPYKA